jgi:hypothetical protein
VDNTPTVVYTPSIRLTALAVLRSRSARLSEGWLTISTGKSVPQRVKEINRATNGRIILIHEETSMRRQGLNVRR